MPICQLQQDTHQLSSPSQVFGIHSGQSEIMATLKSLKQVLREEAQAHSSFPEKFLSWKQYSDGFDILRDSEWTTYENFTIPQLSQLLTPLCESRLHGISALEIGPGPKSVLGYLPDCLREKVRTFTAFEPNELFAAKLNESLCSTSEPLLLGGLEHSPNIQRAPFKVQGKKESSIDIDTGNDDKKYDIILFYHSMYDMKFKYTFIKKVLKIFIKSKIIIIFY